MKTFHDLSEREQMDLAAKAAGLKLFWDGSDSLPPAIDPPFVYWNPKHDDGDSLRLSVALDIQIEYIGKSSGPTTEVNCWPRGRGDCAACHQFGDDKQAATRRSIFEAAVLVGMGMPS